MNRRADQRASERISVCHRVRVTSPQRKTAVLTVLVNLSLGGALLQAASALPVGSPCEVSVLQGKAQVPVQLLGTVVRSDAAGTAVRFAEVLPAADLQSLIHPPAPLSDLPLIRAYADYFRVTQHPTNEACEELLGVSQATLRRVFFTSFALCIPAAILPVWALRDSLPAFSLGAKMGLSMLYGGLWLGFIQPTVDLLALRVLRQRA